MIIHYIFITFFYRFTSGMLVMLISWLILANSQHKEGVIVLGVSLILSQIPAFFSNICLKLLKRVETRFDVLTALSIFLLSIVVLIMSIFDTNAYILPIFNFILWIIFFILEALLEAWFVKINKNIKTTNINLSSITMTVNQIGLMIGPLFLSVIWHYGLNTVLYTVILFYIIISIWIYFIRSDKTPLKTSSDNNTSRNIFSLKGHFSNLLFLAATLVWPTLTAINFMLPSYVQKVLKKDISVLAYAEVYLALGTLIIGGFLIVNFFNKNLRIFFLITNILISIIFIYFENLYVSMFFLGMSFGGGRILLRELLSKNHNPKEVSIIISNANSVGVVVSIIIISISITNFNLIKYIPSLVCSLFLSFIILFIIKKFKFWA